MITKYITIMGALDAFILAGKIISYLNTKPGFFNPPLGEASTYILPLCLAVTMGITVVLPLMDRRHKPLKRLVKFGIAIIVASVLGYGWSVQRHGRPIEIPARGISDFVIVGTQRTPFANQYFANDSDTDMLEKGGWSEDDIERDWTHRSLNRSRTLVMLTFILAFASFNLIVAATAARYCNKADPPKNATET